MKKISLSLLFFFLACTCSWADNRPDPDNKKEQLRYANYMYQISVGSQDTLDVTMYNGMINSIKGSQTRSLEALGIAYKSAFTQKTVNATSNLISLGVNYVTAMVQKNPRDFESWSKMKQQQCNYRKDLSSQESIDDFYYLPSRNGALDPRDLKFNGFVCKNYLKVAPLEGEAAPQQHLGHDVFYVSCKLRTDSLGIAHMANHSKFMLEVDSLVFYPRYCNIPNETPKSVAAEFNYEAYTNLQLEIRVKVFSSWINEAIMVTNDCQLGEFVIHAKIDEKALRTVGNDKVFVYNGTDPSTKALVNISGESFLVPRSFVGTSAEPVWGTGQYRLAIEVAETCQLDAEYYIAPEHYIEIEEVGNGRAVNFANLPGYKMWNKAVWKEEWRTMKKRNPNDSFVKNAWKEIKTAYIGNNWVKELVDPAVTQILLYETEELQKLFNLDAPAQSAAPGRK